MVLPNGWLFHSHQWKTDHGISTSKPFEGHGNIRFWVVELLVEKIDDGGR